MEYKGYQAMVTFDEDLGILHGEVIDTRDVITFQGKSVDELEQSFRVSVEEYLKICEERGRVPDKPFSGRVVLRMEPETHRAVAGAARLSGKSLNAWILEAIDHHLTRTEQEKDPIEFDLQFIASSAASAFEEFLDEVLRRHGGKDPVSPLVPFWVDLHSGSLWASDVRPVHEVFSFEASAPYHNSVSYSSLNEFLTDRVNLGQNRLDRLDSTVGAINNQLKDHLGCYQGLHRHGSYALGTLIKPAGDNDEYDADIQVVMKPTSQWEPKDYIHEVHRTLAANKTYADKLRLKTRCVTVEYAGDFHLDVVPLVTMNGKYYVCNRIGNKFEESDGDGFGDWFNEKSRITDGNLKRVVRLLKFLRDHKNSFTAESILLTTLAGNTIKASDEEREAVSTVADTLVTVLTRMDDYLQRHPSMPEVKNPVLDTEDFSQHWDQQKYANFRDGVNSYALTAKMAKKELNGEKAIKLWRELFGDTFGAPASSDSSGRLVER